ncbi:MAG: hypothetical protein IJ092_10205 [Atopobiaceae bacterium]|nr:hypothetical protein [Atopobiaceae bacterium]
MAEYVVEGPSSQNAGWRVHERIVRCRDCEHYREHEWILVTDVSDVCHFFGDGVKVEPDGFCKWGKRKEVGDGQ